MFKYEIEEILNLDGGKITYSVYIGDEHETDCDTLAAAHLVLARHNYQCAMLEFEARSRSVPYETD